MYKESDLFKPIKDYFAPLGYTINAEVKGADITLLKDDVLTIIEIKKNFNISLIYQAIDAQKIADYVYIAIPRQKTKTPRQRKTINLTRHIATQLGLGIITVAMDTESKKVEILLDPIHTKEIGLYKSYIKRKATTNEINGRKVDLNKGGSTRKKLSTAYLEKAIQIACIMENFEEVDTKTLIKQFDCPKETTEILYRNYYKWFDKKQSRGVYALNNKGRKELNNSDFKQIVDFYRGCSKENG